MSQDAKSKIIAELQKQIAFAAVKIEGASLLEREKWDGYSQGLKYSITTIKLVK
jgi:hypothetical protein